MQKITITLLLSIIYINLQAQVVQKTMKRLPDTGQISDYTKTFGEDSDYLINAPFYSLFSTKIVVDTITGLMWQRNDSGEMTVENARIYCDTLTLGGFSDWRLPTAHESYSLLNQDKQNPAIDLTFFSNSGAEYWWTSDVRNNDANRIWATNAGGGIGAHPKTETKSAGGTKKFHARAVRDVSSPQTVIHFTDNGDGTITDNLTNLQWLKTPLTDTLSWEKALQYAENLVFAGFSDWRLPNIKELNSINDESTNAPSANKTFFPTLKSARYWSSTTQKGQTQNAWFNDFQNYGITSYFAKSKGYNVICVRNKSKITAALTTFEEKLDLQVFPNPTNDILNVQFSSPATQNYDISLYDWNGKLLLHQILRKDNSTISIDTRTIYNGIYLLKITSGKEILIRKVEILR